MKHRLFSNNVFNIPRTGNRRTQMANSKGSDGDGNTGNADSKGKGNDDGDGNTDNNLRTSIEGRMAIVYP